MKNAMGGIVGTGLVVLLSVMIEDLDCNIKLLLPLIFCSIAAERRHSGTILFSQLSGHSDSVRKLCVTWRKVDKGELGVRNLYKK